MNTWGHIPTSDPYHFITWANGINGSSHLEFPGSQDQAYGQYPNGFPMLLQMLSTTTGLSTFTLTQYLHILLGSLCVLPVYLIMRNVATKPSHQAAGTAIAVFAFAFIKYTSVSIPNLVGLFLFAFVMWLALQATWTTKRLVAIVAVTVPAIAKIHYLSLVCVGILLAIIALRKVMLLLIDVGPTFNPRKLLFLLIAALVAGVFAWTAAYRVMNSVYGIDITSQPPPRISIVLKVIGYPVVFGFLQTLSLPLGIIGIAIYYRKVHFGRGERSLPVDPLLLFSLWMVFFILSVGFLNVEYYPFRFNCFLMIPFGMLCLIGILYFRDILRSRAGLKTLAPLVLPVTVVLVVLQPLVISVVPVSEGEPLLPWKQEYGQTEISVLGGWMQEELLSVLEETNTGIPRQQIIMADWVRSRALAALGSDDIHLHWWFFQGWVDSERKPYELRSLDVYSGDIIDALKILGRLNLRNAYGSTGEWVYYYKYIYTSDWIAQVMSDDFGEDADFGKFDEYNGSLFYSYGGKDPYGEADSVLPRTSGRIGTNEYPVRPFDKLYSCPGVDIYYFTPLKKRGYS